MPLPTIADVYRCTLNWEFEGREVAHNVIHLRWPTSAEDDVFTALEAAVDTEMWRCVPSTFAVTSVSIIKLDGTPLGFTFETDGTSDWDGNGGTQWIPNAAGIVTFRTATAGRRGRGRIFLPMSEDNQADGILTSATVTALQDAWTAFIGTIAGLGPELVVASYEHTASANVTSVTAQPVMGTQQRRLRRIRRG